MKRQERWVKLIRLAKRYFVNLLSCGRFDVTNYIGRRKQESCLYTLRREAERGKETECQNILFLMLQNNITE